LALVTTAHRLNRSGVHALGRLAFVSDAFFGRLVDEARRQLAPGVGDTRSVGRAGDALAALAVSRQLRSLVSRTLGVAVTPTFDAVYEYDPPGTHVQTHVDSREYEIVCHLLLDHTSDAGDGTSTLVAHLPGHAAPTHVSLRPGDAVILLGRGTLHSWMPLTRGERRILTAIGFRRERSATMSETRQAEL
jgi:predicted 2-oxoglutarate/Fe(II)-dependent dioxygenase YbiX